MAISPFRLLILVLATCSLLGCGQTPPAPGTPLPAPVGGDKEVDQAIDKSLEQLSVKIAEAEDHLKLMNVSILIYGIRDADHEALLSAKVQGLRDAQAKSHSFTSQGAYYSADGYFKVSPVSDLDAAAAKIDFGRVVALDPVTRVLLIDAAAKPTPRPAEGWPGVALLDAHAVRKSVEFAAKFAVKDLVQELGSEKVAVVALPQGKGSPDDHEIVKKLRTLAPKTLATSFPGFGPQNKNFVYVTVAPIEKLDDLVAALAGETIIAVDKERRVILIGDLADLKPAGPKLPQPRRALGDDDLPSGADQRAK